MKKALSVLLALLICATVLPMSILSAGAATDGSGDPHTVTVNINGSGSVSVDPLSAAEGDYVTVVMTAEDGWFLKEMLVTNIDGEQFTKLVYHSPSFEEDTDGFTMPGDPVTLTVTFAKPEEFTSGPDDPLPHDPEAPYTITFDANGGTGSMEVATAEYGESYTLPKCGYSKVDRSFYKWEINGVEYDEGDTVTITGDTLVKAVWKYNGTTIDNSVDVSSTQVVGILKLTDLRTGEVTEYTVTDETALSEFNVPGNPNVNAMIEEAQEALIDQLENYSDVQNVQMSVSDPEIMDTRDNRTFTYFDNGYDESGDYYNSYLIIDGDYYHVWRVTVTLEAEYIGVPMSYIHTLSSEGGFVEFWCDAYTGDYYQPYAVPEGAEVNLIAIPENGYEFIGWYKGDVNASSYDEMFTDELISTENHYVFNATGYPYICAKFAYTGVVWPQGDQIQVWITDGGKASVVYEPSVEGHPYIKPMDGSKYVAIGEVVQFWKGDEITVYQQADEGYVFKGWYHVRIEWGPDDELPKYEGEAISVEPTFTYKPGVTVVEGDEEPLRYVCAVFEKKSVSDDLLLGDVDGDGKVTIYDASAIQRQLAGITVTAFIDEAADVDGDGKVTIYDASAIQRYLAGFTAPEGIGKPK